mmetsp:Transcript_9751/g.25174  ORF Transcript_9751/g.25174 Transcript_9751/m.25174 type:complete len:235 (+) Transcript_9751:501-1205(+)
MPASWSGSYASGRASCSPLLFACTNVRARSTRATVSSCRLLAVARLGCLPRLLLSVRHLRRRQEFGQHSVPPLLPLPVVNQLAHLGKHLILREALAIVVSKLALRIDQVGYDRVVEQVVPAFDLIGSGFREVHTVCAARLLDLVVVPRQRDEAWMEASLREVGLQAFPCIARWVDGDEDGLDGLSLGFETIQHARHFVELIWANVWTLGEPKVEEDPLAAEVGVAHPLAARSDQ